MHQIQLEQIIHYSEQYVYNKYLSNSKHMQVTVQYTRYYTYVYVYMSVSAHRYTYINVIHICIYIHKYTLINVYKCIHILHIPMSMSKMSTYK